ncbi:hypothetical protein [Nocardia terpenica]|nr:hypothetical protein [Nocardia terpenica]
MSDAVQSAENAETTEDSRVQQIPITIPSPGLSDAAAEVRDHRS